MPRRPWTDEDKANALALYTEHESLAVATAMTGIPKSTIQYWAQEAGLPAYNTEKTAAAVKQSVENRAARWEERRAELANKIGVLAEIAVNKAAQYLVDGDAASAQKAATTMGIAIDKAQLLTGQATGRIEHGDANGELAAEVARLVEERRSVAPGTVSMDSRRTA